MIGTSHGPVSGEHGPIEKILAAYQSHALNSLKGPALSRDQEQRLSNYPNNFDLYNYYLQYQQEFLSPSWLESEDNSKGRPEMRLDFQAYLDSLSSQKADQHRAAMAQFYNYYQQYCHSIPTLPPHFPPYLAPGFMSSPTFKTYQQHLCWPPPQALSPFVNNHKYDVNEDSNAKTLTNSTLSIPEESNEHQTSSNRPQTPSNLPILLTTNLESCSIPCFDVGGELRLCLPQLLNTVLGRFALRQINAACDRLHIYCSRCDADQLIVLKRAHLLSLAAPDCGLITKTDAQRLCDHLLRASPHPSGQSADAGSGLSSIGFDVYHECFGRGRGRVYPDLYVTPSARCIECLECGTLLAPPQFVSHSHRPSERRVCHWGFDRERWRSYLLVGSSESTEQPCSSPLSHVNEGVDKSLEPTESSPNHVTERRASQTQIENNETKLKAFKDKFLDSQQDQMGQQPTNGHYNFERMSSPTKTGKLIAPGPPVVNPSNRPPPKKRARSGAASFQPIDYCIGPNSLKKIYNSSPYPSEVKRSENACSHPKNYYFSETNIQRLTPLTTSSSSTLDKPISISNPPRISSIKLLPLSKSVNADDKLSVNQSSASLDLSRGESSKRKRFLSVNEGICLMQDDKDLTQEFNKSKISSNNNNISPTTPLHDTAVKLEILERKEHKHDTTLTCLKTVTSHFVDLSKDMMLEIDNYAKKVIVHSNPLVFDELKARLLGHLSFKHDALQSYLSQVLKSYDHV